MRLFDGVVRLRAMALACFCGSVGAAASLTGFAVRAETRPLWEAGAGLGGLVLPDYRGSDESRAYVEPR